ncbi:MAG: hypothetical protein WCW25_03665 [Patescibacteria group bacterium]|jgi:hypothetical protein
MINILGKVNKNNYKNFSNSDFPGYEVFLGSEKDFKYLPAILRRLNVVSVHEPARDFDLAFPGARGEKSYQLLVSLLAKLDKLGFKGVMVIHGAFFNEIAGEKKICQKALAGRLDALAVGFPKIIISLESDILFFNQILENRALLARPEDFLELKKYLRSKLYITLDFEHALISSLFEEFIKNHNRFYIRVSNLDDINKPAVLAAKDAWLMFIKKNKNQYNKIFSVSLKKYAKLKKHIVHFHLSPSDMSGYWYDKKTFVPLTGEHLCVSQVNDKLNYQLIKNFLSKLAAKDLINVVLEIWPRDEKRYVSQLKNSGREIKKIWRLKK